MAAGPARPFARKVREKAGQTQKRGLERRSRCGDLSEEEWVGQGRPEEQESNRGWGMGLQENGARLSEAVWTTVETFPTLSSQWWEGEG